MNKFLKLLAKIVGLLIILYILLMVGIHFFLQPNTYKSLITKAFYKATGRNITIEGKVGLSLFPTPTITVNQITVANRKGFIAPKSANYFAKIGKAYLRLHMRPLFSGKIRPSKLLLTHASVNLITTASGKNNWSDLLDVNKHKNKTSSSRSLSTHQKNTNANFPEIIISDSNIHFVCVVLDKTLWVINPIGLPRNNKKIPEEIIDCVRENAGNLEKIYFSRTVLHRQGNSAWNGPICAEIIQFISSLNRRTLRKKLRKLTSKATVSTTNSLKDVKSYVCEMEILLPSSLNDLAKAKRSKRKRMVQKMRARHHKSIEKRSKNTMEEIERWMNSWEGNDIQRKLSEGTVKTRGDASKQKLQKTNESQKKMVKIPDFPPAPVTTTDGENHELEKDNWSMNWDDYVGQIPDMPYFDLEQATAETLKKKGHELR